MLSDSEEFDELAVILADDSMERAEIYADISHRLKSLAMLLMIMKEGADVVFPLMCQARALLEKAIAQIDQALLIHRCTTTDDSVDA